MSLKITNTYKENEEQNESENGATVYMRRLVHTVQGYLCSSLAQLSLQLYRLRAGFKTDHFSYLQSTFYLQHVELCRQKVVQNVVSGPALRQAIILTCLMLIIIKKVSDFGLFAGIF